jgi:hypothetical protein
MSSPINRITELMKQRWAQQKALAATQIESSDLIQASRTLENMRLDLENIKLHLNKLWQAYTQYSGKTGRSDNVDLSQFTVSNAVLVKLATSFAESLGDGKSGAIPTSLRPEDIGGEVVPAGTIVEECLGEVLAELAIVNTKCTLKLATAIAVKIYSQYSEQTLEMTKFHSRRQYIAELEGLQGLKFSVEKNAQALQRNLSAHFNPNQFATAINDLALLHENLKAVEAPAHANASINELATHFAAQTKDRLTTISKSIDAVKHELEDEEAALLEALTKNTQIRFDQLTTEVAPNIKFYVNNPRTWNHENEFFLGLAIRAKRYDVVAWLLNNGAANTNVTRDRNFPAHLALACDPEITLEHFKLIAEPKLETFLNTSAKAGNTLLHLAVRAKRSDIVEWLLAKGAKTTYKNEKGQFPLDLALATNPPIEARKLLEGLTLEEEAKACKTCLAVNPDVPLTVLQHYFETNIAKTINDYTLASRYYSSTSTSWPAMLFAAVKTGRDDVITWLLDNKADISLRDDRQCFAFSYAKAPISLAVAKRLIPEENSSGLIPQLRTRCQDDITANQSTLLWVWIPALYGHGEKPQLLRFLVEDPQSAGMIKVYREILSELQHTTDFRDEFEAFYSDDRRYYSKSFTSANSNHQFAKIMDYQYQPKSDPSRDYGFRDFTLIELALLCSNVEGLTYLLSLEPSNAPRLSDKYNSSSHAAQRRTLIFNFIIHRDPQNTHYCDAMQEADWHNARALIQAKSPLVPEAVLKLATDQRYALVFSGNFHDREREDLGKLQQLMQRVVFTYFMRGALHSGHGDEGKRRAVEFLRDVSGAYSVSAVWSLLSDLLLEPTHSADKYSLRVLLLRPLLFSNQNTLQVLLPNQSNKSYTFEHKSLHDCGASIAMGLLIKMHYLPMLEAQMRDYPVIESAENLLSRLKKLINDSTYQYLLRNFAKSQDDFSLDGVKKAAVNWEKLMVPVRQYNEAFCFLTLKEFLNTGNSLTETSHRTLVVNALFDDKVLTKELGLESFKAKQGAYGEDLRRAKLKFVQEKLEVYCKAKGYVAQPVVVEERAERREERASTGPSFWQRGLNAVAALRRNTESPESTATKEDGNDELTWNDKLGK